MKRTLDNNNMDILDFSEEIKNFQHNGVTLNLDERMQLEMALMTLNEKTESEELVFWGKINGLKSDYYIAMALRYTDMYEFPVKTFYWALSTEFVFREMPALTEQHDEKIDGDTGYFLGEPAKVLGKQDGDEDDEEEKKQEQQEEEEEGEGGEEMAKNSEETSEEEIQVPTKPLTGKALSIS